MALQSWQYPIKMENFSDLVKFCEYSNFGSIIQTQNFLKNPYWQTETIKCIRLLRPNSNSPENSHRIKRILINIDEMDIQIPYPILESLYAHLVQDIGHPYTYEYEISLVSLTRLRIITGSPVLLLFLGQHRYTFPEMNPSVSQQDLQHFFQSWQQALSHCGKISDWNTLATSENPLDIKLESIIEISKTGFDAFLHHFDTNRSLWKSVIAEDWQLTLYGQTRVDPHAKGAWLNSYQNLESAFQQNSPEINIRFDWQGFLRSIPTLELTRQFRQDCLQLYPMDRIITSFLPADKIQPPISSPSNSHEVVNTETSDPFDHLNSCFLEFNMEFGIHSVFSTYVQNPSYNSHTVNIPLSDPLVNFWFQTDRWAVLSFLNEPLLVLKYSWLEGFCEMTFNNQKAAFFEVTLSSIEKVEAQTRFDFLYPPSNDFQFKTYQWFPELISPQVVQIGSNTTLPYWAEINRMMQDYYFQTYHVQIELMERHRGLWIFAERHQDIRPHIVILRLLQSPYNEWDYSLGMWGIPFLLHYQSARISSFCYNADSGILMEEDYDTIRTIMDGKLGVYVLPIMQIYTQFCQIRSIDQFHLSVFFQNGLNNPGLLEYFSSPQYWRQIKNLYKYTPDHQIFPITDKKTQQEILQEGQSRNQSSNKLKEQVSQFAELNSFFNLS